MSINRRDIGQLIGVCYALLQDDIDSNVTYGNLTNVVGRISQADLVTLVNRAKNEGDYIDSGAADIT